MKRNILITVIVFIFLMASFLLTFSMSPTKDINDSVINKTKKPVILITIDSLMSQPLQKVIQEGKAPAFSFLINNGQFHPEVISSYPTMSVTIDSTVLTGTYADQHKIPGLIWFKEDENRIISYGSGLSEIWSLGVRNVALDSIVHLNEEHLSKNVQTIHEKLSNSNIQSASINGLVYRGSFKHQLNVPKLISAMRLLPNDIDISGPTLLSLGTLSQYNSENDYHKLAWKRMGVNNQFTVNELKLLIEQNKLPAFTLAYLPDADKDLHKNGPDEMKAIEKADKHLQELLNSYSTWEEAIEQTIWIVHGDSAQSTVLKDKDTSLIDLNDLLKDYSFWERENTNGEIAIAINERMAYINLNDENMELSEVVKILKKDQRIGIIAWKEGETNYVISPQSNLEFTFSPKGSFKDLYDQSWELNGDQSILNLSIDSGGRIEYGDYPDALARLYGALHSHEGRFIIVDAKPQYEFIEKHSHDHAGGGAHGSLHKIDSVVPLIIAGTHAKPEYNRLVDFKEWILNLTK
ncbi:alkaline phosphatase family protein [Psychrobacillus soli]|uniref:Alkaline phosphatase family protein n=1 Tax=Psychrobacillus soli TaxID=1543965 RepID=A0A544TDG2_9BACI|nr:alkaline phosphatase family protein [Psychrobacillus soli]TQR15446.1 alkaline phosphatase family protein [Psychrobacillus soli]